MPVKKVFVTRRRVPEAITLLEKHFDVEVWEEQTPPPREVLLAQVAESHGILTEIDDIVDEEVLRSSTTLKVVANRAVGLDNVNVDEATRCGIAISNTPGVLHESCADFTFALILAAARNVVFSDREVRAGAWTMFDQMPYLGADVHGATLGIVGLGRIGQAVARRARGFDMRVLYHSRTRKPEREDDHAVEWIPDLPSLLRESDFVSIHVPLNSDTERFIGQREFEQMKSSAVLVNTSRGRTVDSEALYEALANGAIAGAALDVTEPEPLPLNNPLLTLPNVIITPHLSSASAATVRKMGLMAAENIIAALTGKPMPSCFNPEALEAQSQRS